MTIAYILYWPAGAESGVFKKICNQVGAWINAGHKVTVIQAGPAAKREGYEKGFAAVGAKLEYRLTDTSFQRWGRWLGLKDILRRGNFDAVYHRFDLATPGLVAAMTPNRWTIELNSNDLTEYALTPGARNTFNRLTRDRLFRKAGGSIFPTVELSKAPAFAAFNKTRLALGNGGDFSIKPAHAPSPDAPIELLFIASEGQEWHGIDKLPALARANPDWTIHALGVTKFDCPEGVPSNIKLSPRLTRTQYEPIVARCAAGIGSLALHRIQMFEGSPLKVREYAAFGLPLILACPDVDVPENAPYALQLPNSEDNIAKNLPAIRDFIEKWRGRRVPREQVAHMDWVVKEQTRLKFIQSVAGVS